MKRMNKEFSTNTRRFRVASRYGTQTINCSIFLSFPYRSYRNWSQRKIYELFFDTNEPPGSPIHSHCCGSRIRFASISSHPLRSSSSPTRHCSSRSFNSNVWSFNTNNVFTKTTKTIIFSSRSSSLIITFNIIRIVKACKLLCNYTRQIYFLSFSTKFVAAYVLQHSTRFIV